MFCVEYMRRICRMSVFFLNFFWIFIKLKQTLVIKFPKKYYNLSSLLYFSKISIFEIICSWLISKYFFILSDYRQFLIAEFTCFCSSSCRVSRYCLPKISGSISMMKRNLMLMYWKCDSGILKILFKISICWTKSVKIKKFVSVINLLISCSFYM